MCIEFIPVFYGKGQIYSKEKYPFLGNRNYLQNYPAKKISFLISHPFIHIWLIKTYTHTQKRSFYLSQIPKWYLFRFMINMQKGVAKHVNKIITHKWMCKTSPWNSRKLTLQIFLVTSRKYAWSILEVKAKNL